MKDALGHYVRVYENALDPAFCDGLVAAFEANVAAQSRNGRHVHPALDRSAWTELDAGRLGDDAFRGFFLSQIEHWLARYNRDVGLTIPVPLSPRTDRLILKRYAPGGDEGFQPHFDSIDAVAGRYLVFLWYLNDVEAGGETEFVDLGLRVPPRRGSLLVFPPYWMFQHAGRAPISGNKYILSTYLMF